MADEPAPEAEPAPEVDSAADAEAAKAAVEATKAEKAKATIAKLSEDEVEQYKDAFKLFDKDGGGSIDAEVRYVLDVHWPFKFVSAV